MKKPRVCDLMTRTVETIRPHEDLDLAHMAMRLDGVRHLPVLDDDDRLVGVVSHRDVLRAQASSRAGLPPEEVRRLALRIRASEVMTTNPVVVGPDTPAVEAGRLLRERKIGCLPVLDDERLVGIITETDFLTYAIRAMEEG